MPTNPKRKVSAELSSIVRITRFPLIFCVVLVHTCLPMENDLPTTVFKVLPPRVEMWFLISSYLFFYSFEGWDWGLFGDKLRRRFHSLFIPYLIWNAFALLVFFLVHQLFPGQISSGFMNVGQFTAMEYLRSFWDVFDGNPISYPLWFLRDLMVLFLFAPLFHVLLRGRLGWGVIAVILLNELFQFVDVRAVNSASWFAIGSFLAIQQFDVVKQLKESRYATIVLYLAFMVASFFSDAFLPFSRFIGVFAAFDIARILVNRGIKVPDILTEVTFFVYVFHGCIIMMIAKAITRLWQGNQVMLVIGYFMAPVLMTIICVCIYCGLKRLFPRVTSVIVGKRMK